MKKFLIILFLFQLIGCFNKTKAAQPISDHALLDSVQHRTFLYFWDGAEPISGMARERYHVDDVYPKNDKNIVTSGGSGFGIMAIIAGIERGYVSREQGYERIDKMITFLENADRYHGVYPHWWYGETGKVKSFSGMDNGGDLVETSFLMQGLLAAHQYFVHGNTREKELAYRIDRIWKEVDWDWYRNNKNILYWHWSPEFLWGINFAIHGYNECLITYVLAAASPTHGVPAEVYHQGWAQNDSIIAPHEVESHKLNMRYQNINGIGPLFWAHYSFLGLNPNGLKDKYADYFHEMRNFTLINRDYCVRNPNNFKGYGTNCWGLTASYSLKGYAAHMPESKNDVGVISPTAAISSIVYAPKESMLAMRYFYDKGDKLWGKYGFYDAFCENEDWYPQRYLAIDQGPISVMIENYRSKLLWHLFMSHPDVQNGLKKLGFKYVAP